ncbi:MAG TPA: carboxymuconolactone decarboxylase family protein [Streptosporangiaceae bacterium]|jgi:AhpD family alkylhydroperoxidase
MTSADTADTPVRAPQRRLDLPKLSPAFYKAMNALDQAASAGLDPLLLELIKIRASQLNGCAFCLDMHTQDALAKGEQAHRLNTLAAWRETPYFTERERAALALTESVTLLADTHVPDEVYDEAALRFSDEELAQVIAMAVAINAWNRIGVTTRLSPPAR